MPPVSVKALINSCDLFRLAGCHQLGLAWVMVIGRDEHSIASKLDLSDE